MLTYAVAILVICSMRAKTKIFQKHFELPRLLVSEISKSEKNQEFDCLN